MFKRLMTWYKGLTPVKRLLLSFLLNWIYWLFAWKLAEQFIFEETRSWDYHLFHATWMSFFMTLLFNWRDIKLIFNPPKE